MSMSPSSLLLLGSTTLIAVTTISLPLSMTLVASPALVRVTLPSVAVTVTSPTVELFVLTVVRLPLTVTSPALVVETPRLVPALTAVGASLVPRVISPWSVEMATEVAPVMLPFTRMSPTFSSAAPLSEALMLTSLALLMTSSAEPLLVRVTLPSVACTVTVLASAPVVTN